MHSQVVRDFSSSFPLESSKVTIDANHMGMTKYSSKDDDGYRRVIRKLQGPCEQIAVLHEVEAAEEKLDEREQRQ